ncbi:hypothetical protein HBB16_13975 [Pseudonocardia sp. MCCB 268]|nr:hypothetical protein [Pseudonocardia cytotoxica]
MTTHPSLGCARHGEPVAAHRRGAPVNRRRAGLAVKWRSALYRPWPLAGAAPVPRGAPDRVRRGPGDLGERPALPGGRRTLPRRWRLKPVLLDMADTAWAPASSARRPRSSEHLDVRQQRASASSDRRDLSPGWGGTPGDGICHTAAAGNPGSGTGSVRHRRGDRARMATWRSTRVGDKPDRVGGHRREQRARLRREVLGEQFWRPGQRHLDPRRRPPPTARAALDRALAEGLDATGTQVKTYHPRQDQTSATWFADAR